MKKPLSFLLALAMCGTLAACGGQGADTPSQAPETTRPTQPPASTQPQETPSTVPTEDVSTPDEPGNEANSGSNILIAYFAYGENAALADGVDASTSASIQYRGDTPTGNTGLVAGMIADATGGDLFSILTVEQYPDNYNDTLDAAQAEKSANARPELTSHIDDLDRYDTVFLGFPNWWGDMPMAVYSFLDEYDLSGKIIVPFVTSGGSGFSNTIRAIESAEPDATVLEGLSLRDSSSTQAEGNVADWLAKIELAE
ncbi:MAG: flavodoxin [Ruminococcus flavefaciens]|nr:flavodoxin [Ruminococcus flavefaciens]